MTIDTSALPAGWGTKRVGDTLKLRNGHAFKPTDWAASGRPIIRIQNLKSGAAAYNHYQGELPDRFKAQPGDLLFAWSGTPGTSFGAHIWEGPEAWVNQHIFRVDFSEDDFDRDFLKLALNYNLADYIAQAQGGVGLAHITKVKLNQSLLVHPPVPVQKAIAELIERHDVLRTSAINRLKAAEKSVERFRHAVLAAACSGRLTADWRVEHPDLVSEETCPDERGTIESLVEIPDEWKLTQLASIANLKGGIQKGAQIKPGTVTREVPYLRVANVQRGWLDLSEIKTIVAPETRIAELRLEAGDILFNEGGDRDKLGRGWIWEGQIAECIHQNHVFRGRLHNPRMQPAFYSWFGNTFGAPYFEDQGKQTVNLASLNMKTLKALPVPVPSTHEQAEIVRRVHALWAQADPLRDRIQTATARVDRSLQAVLAKAFRGELTPGNA